MINWKVRIKNKTFWIAVIPALLVFVEKLLCIFDLSVDLSGISGLLVDMIEALFVVLALIGIVVDPTTAGASDSAQALTYTKPKED